MNLLLGAPTHFDTILTDNDKQHYNYICKLLSKMKINKAKDIIAHHGGNHYVKLDYFAYFKGFNMNELYLMTQQKADMLWNSHPYTHVQGSWNTFAATYLSA